MLEKQFYRHYVQWVYNFYKYIFSSDPQLGPPLYLGGWQFCKNNINNSQDNVYRDKVIARVHLMNVEQCKAAADPQTKPTVRQPVCCYRLYSPLPYSITQPKSW